jgi:hypothetical protein
MCYVAAVDEQPPRGTERVNEEQNESEQRTAEMLAESYRKLLDAQKLLSDTTPMVKRNGA